jgi:hypothetical protein
MSISFTVLPCRTFRLAQIDANRPDSIAKGHRIIQRPARLTARAPHHPYTTSQDPC